MALWDLMQMHNYLKLISILNNTRLLTLTMYLKYFSKIVKIFRLNNIFNMYFIRHNVYNNEINKINFCHNLEKHKLYIFILKVLSYLKQIFLNNNFKY